MLLSSWSRYLRALLAAGVFACARPDIMLPSVYAQTEVSTSTRMSDALREKLLKPGDLTLRDANFVEAMFSIRRLWGVNIVVSNDLKNETVSCEFSDTPLHEILDTILTSRGYGYRPLGNSLVIVKQDAVGALKFGFQSATIAVNHIDPNELERALSFYLSDRGQIQIVPSAKSIVVIDFPERIEQLKQKAEELDASAKKVADREAEAVKEAENIATNTGAAAATGTPATQPAPANLPLAVYFDLQFVKAESVAPALQPLLNLQGKISIMTKDNRLVVYDTQEKLDMIAAAIRSLDVPRPQVRISALIYDVSLEDIRRFGINWNGTGFKSLNLNANGVAQDSAMLTALTAAAPASGTANGALTLTSLGSNFDVTAVINALANASDSRLLADPNVVIYDMESAKIDSVREIPFQQLTQGSQGGPIGTTAFREAGITLTVTPQISDDDTLLLNVNPKFSILAGLTSGTNQPIIDRREYSGTVRVRNRETLVIGGMRQREFNRKRTGIPYLMDIRGPVGKLFKNNDATVRDSELIVFLTPEVVDLNYMGRNREHCIFNHAVPSLDSIPHPRIPEKPCPLEDWKHRCGCGHHQGKCDGRCPRCKSGECQVSPSGMNMGETVVEVREVTTPLPKVNVAVEAPPPAPLHNAPPVREDLQLTPAHTPPVKSATTQEEVRPLPPVEVAEEPAIPAVKSKPIVSVLPEKAVKDEIKSPPAEVKTRPLPSTEIQSPSDKQPEPKVKQSAQQPAPSLSPVKVDSASHQSPLRNPIRQAALPLFSSDHIELDSPGGQELGNNLEPAIKHDDVALTETVASEEPRASTPPETTPEHHELMPLPGPTPPARFLPNIPGLSPKSIFVVVPRS